MDGSARTLSVAAPGLALDRQAPSSAASRSARPRRPVPRTGRRRRPRRRGPRRQAAVPRHVHASAVALRVLGDVGQGLGDHEVGGGLDRSGQPLVGDLATSTGIGAAWRAPPAPRRARGRSGSPGGCRGRARAARRAPAASSSAPSSSSWPRRGPCEPPFGPAAASARSATSRCWAPSCRSRSSRRRSAAPASTSRARGALQLLDAGVQLGVEPLVLQRERRAAAARAEELGLVAQRAVVDDRGDAATSLRSTGRGACRVVAGPGARPAGPRRRPSAAGRGARRRSERGVAERVAQRVAQRAPCQAPRRVAASAPSPRPRAGGCAQADEETHGTGANDDQRRRGHLGVVRRRRRRRTERRLRSRTNGDPRTTA